MPENDREPAFKIESVISHLYVREVIEADMSLLLCCAACGRETVWAAQDIRRRLGRWPGARLFQAAGRMRCAGCRSPYVWIWRGPGGRGADPAAVA